MLLEEKVSLEGIVKFLKRVPPFQFLDDETLSTIADGLSLESYPKGTYIMKQGELASEYLYIIKKGSVRVSVASSEAEELIIDYRSEGDLLGYLSLFGDKSRANAVVEEDALCYAISRKTVRDLLDSNPLFGEFFLKSYLNIYIDRSFKEIHSKSLLDGCVDKILFTTPVSELITKEVITASEDISIKEAAEIMSSEQISCLVILDADNLPAGIVTDTDLREKVVAKGRDVNEPVKDVMSLPLMRVDDKDYCFEAVLKMVKYNVHHLLVIKNGGLRGVITNHDLMTLQGTSPMSFTKDIENQHSIDGLITVSRKINSTVGLLLREGAKASNITKIITEIYDRLARRVLEIAEKEFGEPPVPYCWIVFGSEGRKEQTFKTDQDNAIILADPMTKEEAEEIKGYFPAFGMFVRDSLLKCGFPLCPADFMASNPKWCQPLKNWKKYFSTWISTPTSDAVLNSVTFFDFRPVYGDSSLSYKLRESLTYAVKDQDAFLGHMANMAIKNRPPISFLKTFVLEKSGEHKDELNLKVKGIAPIVDMVRLFALEKGVKQTSTLERIDILRDKHTIIKEYADDLVHVFEFVMLMRIQHQFEQIRADKGVDNFINPHALVNLDKKTLKEVFHFISKIQDMIIERYKPMIW